MNKAKATLRKGMSMLLTLVMLLGLLPSTVLAAETKSFTDVEGHWAASVIKEAVDQGLFQGTGADKFDPDGGMTRGMFVTVMMRLADKLKGSAPTGAAVNFTDVPADAWFAAGVDWAARTGITLGTSATTFAPNDMVSREQMCVFMVRFLKDYMRYDLSSYKAGAPFADDAAISTWAKEAVYLAQAMGLVTGVGENKFDPAANADRASVAAISTRLLTKTADLKVLPAKPSGGGGGGGGGTTPSVPLSSVYVLRGTADVTGQNVHVGDTLTTTVPDSAIYKIRWSVDGVEKSTTSVYTVANADVGETVTVTVTGYLNDTVTASTGIVISAAVAESRMTLTDKADGKTPTNATYMANDGSFQVAMSTTATYAANTIYSLSTTPHSSIYALDGTPYSDMVYGINNTPYAAPGQAASATTYSIGDTVEAALAATSTAVTGNVTIDAIITDGAGKAVIGTTTKYIVWMDAGNNLMSIEKVSIKVAATPAT